MSKLHRIAINGLLVVVPVLYVLLETAGWPHPWHSDQGVER